MYCRNCGVQIPNGSRFCSNCGAALPIDSGNNFTPNMQVSQKKRTNWFSKLIVFLLVVALFLIGRFLINLDVYCYSKMTDLTSSNISVQELQELDSYFAGTYLYDEEDDYHIFNIENGLEVLGSDLCDIEDDRIDISIKISGNYAYIEITDPASEDRIFFSFYKANLLEKAKFAWHYFL